MTSLRDESDGGRTAPWRKRRLVRRLLGSKDGAAAIEFAILAIPYFMVIFAIIETFVAFSAEQLISNATNNMARQIRTGQITFNLNRASDKTQAQFRQAFCDEIAILIRCSDTEVAQPDRLLLDVRRFTKFSDVPVTIPRVSDQRFADIDPSGFGYNPGGPSTINMVRAFYRWHVTADLVRPYISSVRPADGSASSVLLVATATVQNEAYP